MTNSCARCGHPRKSHIGNMCMEKMDDIPLIGMANKTHKQCPCTKFVRKL